METAFWLNSSFDAPMRGTRSGLFACFFDEKKSSWKDSKHTWVDSVFDADSEYVKKSIGSYSSFQKSMVVFQRSFEKPVFGFFLREMFAYENVPMGLGYRMLKTAGLYIVPVKSYSKNNQVPYILKPILAFCPLQIQTAVWFQCHQWVLL